MGVSGLLPALKASTQQVHISDYRGKRVAVDSYVWLHRAVLTCAADICMNVPTTKYVKYFMNRVQELLAAGIVPILVFDGGKLPAKLAEEESREKRRAHSLAVATNLMREGNRAAAGDHFAKAVDITPQLAHTVQAASSLLGVEIIVAPYEADAQLAFLSRNGYVDAVISEDSDLLVYGCPEVLFKFDSASGMCDRILERDVAACLGFPSSVNVDFLKHVALLNGCDYCPGVNNVGIKKAVELLRELGGDSVVAVNTLRAQGYWIDEKDVQLMKLGILTYKHQVVYNPTTSRLQHLSPLPSSAAAADTSFLGHMYDDCAAVAVASGKADPMTKLPFHPTDELCICARHFALPIASNSDTALNSGAFKRPRMSLPSAAAPPPQAVPSVLSFFKAVPANCPTPLPKSSYTSERALDCAPPEPAVVQARSKYFASSDAENGGSALPFSARGGACGSLFKKFNRGSVEAAATPEQPLVIKSSPRDAIEKLKQYRYHKDGNGGAASAAKDENVSSARRASPVDDECSTGPLLPPAASSALQPLPLSDSLTMLQRLQALAYNPPAQRALQPIDYRPSARASGLKKPTASCSKGASR